MNRILISVLAATVLGVLGWMVAYAQAAALRVDDNGKLVAADEHHHAKVGHVITWVRQTGTNKSWFVRFAGSPCAEGSVFGSDRAKTCTIKVTCNAAGDAGCKSYKYSSATGPNAPMNDPDIIVDP